MVCHNMFVLQIAKLMLLKAQRFEKRRFDGQKVYNTPLCFEFVWTSATLCEMSSVEVKQVKLFSEIDACGCYGMFVLI